MPKEQKSFMMEDAQIMYRNFKGAATKFNTAGDRNFCAILTPDFAEQLASDGWSVKSTNVKEEGDEPIPYIQVKVKYTFKPPRIVMKSSKVTTPLSEDMVDILDVVDIKHVDLICNGSDWDVNGKQGVAAYLKTLVVVIDEDPLELKYHLNELAPTIAKDPEDNE